ncbi:MAG: 2-oxoacid:acceptor oxidoreductase subunit alpha [Deferribacterota bacterium]|nr:2-oxoacid:acceptor oxidoreductase subunit alpha [Deferribacterota bacterium]
MAKKNVKFLMGNHVIAYGAIYAGCKFFAGYPITPSSEIAEAMAGMLPKNGGRFIQMEDEIASMGAIIGASLAGVKSMTATSGPGFSLKQENLGFACLTEVPVVIATVMRGGPSTGMPTGPSQSDIMQTKWGTHGDHPIIVLAPYNNNEHFMLTVRAFNLSEKYRVPVVIATDGIIGQMMEPFELPEKGEVELIERKKPNCKPEEYLPYDDNNLVNPLPAFGEGYRFHVTGLFHDKTGFPTNDGKLHEKDVRRLMAKIDNNYDDIVEVEEFMCDDAEFLIVAIGNTARSAKDAVLIARKKGIKAGLFRPKTLWPFPEKHLEKYIGKVDTIIVPEMNLGQLILEVERIVGDNCKIKGVNSLDVEPISPYKIFETIGRN